MEVCYVRDVILFGKTVLYHFFIGLDYIALILAFGMD